MERPKPCILVAPLGDSPGVVTTAMDALCDEGFQPVQVHCLALPAPGAKLQGVANETPLFRNDSDGQDGPRIAEKGRQLWMLTQGYGDWWTQPYPWNPVVKWWVLNIASDDLTTEAESFRFFQGCTEVLTHVQGEIDRSSGELEGWLSLAGGRKSMAALAHTAAFFCAPSVRLCHVMVRTDYSIHAREHWHPPAEERTFIELPVAGRLAEALPPDVRNAFESALREGQSFSDLNRRYADLINSYAANQYGCGG